MFMDPESKNLLEETFDLEKQNNTMLRKIRSVQKWATFWFWFKLIIIVGVALGSFYFIEPYFQKISNFYSSISGTSQDPSSKSSFQDLLKKF